MFDGDLALVDQRQTARTGDVVAVIVQDEQTDEVKANIKTLTELDGELWLLSANPAVPDPRCRSSHPRAGDDGGTSPLTLAPSWPRRGQAAEDGKRVHFAILGGAFGSDATVPGCPSRRPFPSSALWPEHHKLTEM